jgi:hypothetical protein
MFVNFGINRIAEVEQYKPKAGFQRSWLLWQGRGGGATTKAKVQEKS